MLSKLIWRLLDVLLRISCELKFSKFSWCIQCVHPSAAWFPIDVEFITSDRICSENTGQKLMLKPEYCLVFEGNSVSHEVVMNVLWRSNMLQRTLRTIRELSKFTKQVCLTGDWISETGTVFDWYNSRSLYRQILPWEHEVGSKNHLRLVRIITSAEPTRMSSYSVTSGGANVDLRSAWTTYTRASECYEHACLKT